MSVVIGDLKLPESLPRGTVDEETRKAYEKNMKAYIEADATARFIIGSSVSKDFQEELKPQNVGVPKSMLLNRILNTLPNEYLEFKNAWESVPTSERNIMSLTERLRLHEQRLKEIKGFKLEETTVAFIAKGNTNGFGKKKPSIASSIEEK
ncbi:hypothetical protein CBL_20076, partial [Carabus blaptoides fortunei]